MRRGVFALAATVLLLGAVAAFWPAPALLVRSGSGNVLWDRPLHGPVEVRLTYLHSVERTPVMEIYVAEPGRLHLTRMEFVSQGAGLPTTGYVREGGRFVLRTEKTLTVLSIRVSRLGQPRLSIVGEALDLVALVGDGGVVSITVGRLSRAATLRRWTVR